jgi:putative glycosyltransferase (TIGR04348 family)
MQIGIVTPAPPGSRYGNRVTALRWARFLKTLGHRVQIKTEYSGEPFDLLIALHAKHSHPSVVRFHKEHRERPLVVALTGTDLYRDLPDDLQAQRSLELANRIIALQPKASEALRPELRAKVRVIYQSVSGKSLEVNGPGKRKAIRGAPQTFDVCVIGHLRPVKDPFRTALAARILPSASRIRVVHIGKALTKEMEGDARAEMSVNPRYRWLGEQPKWRAHRLLARSDLCVLSSLMEGGANVLSEAVVAKVPVLASKIAGTVGILGEDYPGYFAVGNTQELAQLLLRTETDFPFLGELLQWGERLVPEFAPAREQAAWAELLSEL